MFYELTTITTENDRQFSIATINAPEMPYESYKPWNGVYPLVEHEYFDTLQEAALAMKLQKDEDDYFKQAFGA